MFNDLVREKNKTDRVYTENGASMYKTSGKELLDLNFAVASLRNATNDEIVECFKKAYYEDKVSAVRWLFFSRDIRENGLGERRLFRVCLRWLATIESDFIVSVIPIIPFYGRFDDLWALLNVNSKVDTAIFDYIEKIISEDLKAYEKGEPISLMAKWLPSINTSSLATRNTAKYIIKGMKGDERTYRKVLSKLRKYLDVVEVKISANEWDKVNYNTVPSLANLKYSNAFYTHDAYRRTRYLEDLKNGTNGAKINAEVLFPHEVVSKYSKNSAWLGRVKEYDEALEQLWKNLPKFSVDKNVLVMCDGSGSMTVQISGNTTALHISNALAIYFAEQMKGEFNNKFMTFGAEPQLVDLSNLTTLHDKLDKSYSYDDCSNTNIEKAFMLVLNTAIKNNYKQSDMPDSILVISDMEFDCATGCGYYKSENAYETLFDTIAHRYEDNGYKMPKLVFWNVNSRTKGIPVQENKLGVTLVSGFSTNIVKMVMSNETDPYKVLMEAINNEIYDEVEKLFVENTNR